VSFKSDQYINAVKFKENLHDNEENEYTVIVNRKPYRHFFKKTQLNLWDNIREDAINYFSEKKISWHINEVENNMETIPEGNMFSSQISCVNHLLILRKEQDYASTILKNIDKRIISAEIVNDDYGNDGYVEFESWGTKDNNNPLKEKEHGILNRKKWKRQRGAFSTSIDAVMVGKKDDGKNILVLIEWKYTESYIPGEIIVTSNSKEYNELLNDKENPFVKIDNLDDLYYDPIYQLMRQTLWAWKIKKYFDCDEYIHLHIIPKKNIKIQEITSPNLKSKGKNMSDVWKNLLKEPFRYKVLSPEELLSPLKDKQDFKVFFDYLKARYLEK
jgi:hypothetical protein